MRKFGRTDANQSAIVRALRAVGCKVESLADVGGGCIDILVMNRGVIYIAEIKDGMAPPSKRRLTPAEKTWHADALAHGVAVYVLENVADALEMVK